MSALQPHGPAGPNSFAPFPALRGFQLPAVSYSRHPETEVREKMRAILVDRLVEVHMKFKLANETLY